MSRTSLASREECRGFDARWLLDHPKRPSARSFKPPRYETVRGQGARPTFFSLGLGPSIAATHVCARSILAPGRGGCCIDVWRREFVELSLGTHEFYRVALSSNRTVGDHSAVAAPRQGPTRVERLAGRFRGRSPLPSRLSSSLRPGSRIRSTVGVPFKAVTGCR